MTTHTPGPWDCWQEPSSHLWRIRKQIENNRKIIGHVVHGGDARLIAAAPDMKEVIEEALYNLSRDGPAAAAAVLNTKGRAAIAKAEEPATS